MIHTVAPSETVSHDDAPASVRALTKRLEELTQARHDSHNHQDRLRLVATLGLLLHSDPAAQAAALDAGALPLLTDTLRMTTASLEQHRATLATTLLLLHDNTHAQDVAVRDGILPVLVAWLPTTGSSSVRILILMVLHAIVRDNGAHRLALLQAGGFRPLHRLSRDRCGAERDHAHQVLTALVAHNDAARAIAQLEAMNLGVHLPADRPRLAVEDHWGAAAFAHSVLPRYLHGQRDADPETTLRRRTAALQHCGASPLGALLALEDLHGFILEHPGLATSAATLVAATVIPHCLERLRGSQEILHHQHAAFILVSLMKQNDALRVHIADAGAGGVDALIEMLGDSHHAAILVLGAIAEADGVGAARAANAGGAIPLVVRVLREGNALERTVAARALNFLVRRDAAAQAEALDAGAMVSVLHLLRSSDNTYEVTQHLLGAVQGLIDGNATAQDAFVDAGGAGVVAELVASRQGGGTVSAAAASAIMFPITGYTRVQDAFTETGVLALLVEQLVHARTTQAAAAASALSALAEGHAANQATIVEGPARGRLVLLLTIGTPRAQFFASLAIYFTTKGGDTAAVTTAQVAFAKAGAIEPLVRLLHESHEYNVPLLAMEALGGLVRRNDVNQVAAVRNGAVVPLIAMLRNDSSQDVYAAATTLAYLMGTTDNDNDDPVKNITELLTLLVEMLASPRLPTHDKSHVALALGDLVGDNAALQAPAVTAGVVEMLVALARTTDVGANERTCFVTVLAGLITTDSAPRALAAGAVHVLVASTCGADSTSPTLSALGALLCIAQVPQPEAIETLLQEGLLDGFGRLLGQEATSAQAIALLCTLVASSTAAASACWDVDLVTPIVRLVTHSSGIQLTHALCTVFKLLTDERAAKRMAEKLPLDVLLVVLRSSEAKDSKLMAICLALMLTEADAVPCARVVEADGVNMIVTMLREDEKGPLTNPLLGMLGCLVGESRADVDADAVVFIRGLMDTSDTKQTMHATAALASIAAVQNDAIAWGVLDPLLTMLRFGVDNDRDPDSRAAAANALASLVDGGHRANQDAVAAAGAVPALVDMLDGIAPTRATTSLADQESAKDAQRWAARTLANLVRCHASNTMVAVRAGAVPPLVEIVRTTDRARNRADSVLALRYLFEMGLTVSVDDGLLMRAAAIDAGAVEALEALLRVEDLADQTMRDARTARACLIEKPVPPMAMRRARIACIPPYC